MSVNTNWHTARLADGTDMRVFVARPQSANGPLPGLLVFQEIYGVNHHIRGVAERLAALGFVAAAPDLFHRDIVGFEGKYSESATAFAYMKTLTEAGLETDVQGTYDLLTKMEGVDASRIGAVGFCLGGRLAFAANAQLPLKAAASFYGGRIAPDHLGKASQQHGPILLFWGGKDTHIGPAQQRAVNDALRVANKTYIDIEFGDANHGFFCDERASYHAASAKQAWALLAAFLGEYM